jgi:formylglycine-generating enzyme required for sulfatase activity
MKPIIRIVAALLLAFAFGSAVGAQAAGNTFKDCDTCPEMVVLAGGHFLMGSAPIVSGKKFPKEEQPQHEVAIASFALGEFEVTQEQWAAVMGANPSANTGATLPVERVAWIDIQEFLQKLNAKTGKHYRLPTESEWEYAARAGSTTLYSFGDDEAGLRDYAWFGGITGNGDGKTHPVGQKQPNAFGLFDIYGNVSEWVADCYVEGYATTPADGSAVAADHCERYVLRGGNWSSVPRSARSASRNRDFPGSRLDDLGFRVAETIE